MQETRNYCFGSKKCSTTLRQTKTGKHECQDITTTLLLYFGALVLTYFCLKKGRTTFFRLETIVASLLHLMVLHFKVIFNQESARFWWKSENRKWDIESREWVFKNCFKATNITVTLIYFLVMKHSHFIAANLFYGIAIAFFPSVSSDLYNFIFIIISSLHNLKWNLSM